MKLHFRLLIVLVLMVIYSGYAQKAQSGNHPFKVYGFIVYGGYVQGITPVNASYKDLQVYLSRSGIQKYDLIYENKLLDYPNGDKANGVVNQSNIDMQAALALHQPGVLVSLDLEGWKRFDTLQTPARMIEAINAFRKTNKVSKIGLYATVPQNTYAWSPTISKYDKVNKSYSAVAAAVDYFSPSLYNYDADTVNWNKVAAYNIDACKKYNFPGKQILPYITPEVDQKGVKRMLTYDEMMNHLQTLYSLGAQGCLIWTSSGMRDANGNKIYIDVNDGWLKAVRDFMASH